MLIFDLKRVKILLQTCISASSIYIGAVDFKWLMLFVVILILDAHQIEGGVAVGVALTCPRVELRVMRVWLVFYISHHLRVSLQLF